MLWVLIGSIGGKIIVKEVAASDWPRPEHFNQECEAFLTEYPEATDLKIYRCDQFEKMHYHDLLTKATR